MVNASIAAQSSKTNALLTAYPVVHLMHPIVRMHHGLC